MPNVPLFWIVDRMRTARLLAEITVTDQELAVSALIVFPVCGHRGAVEIPRELLFETVELRTRPWEPAKRTPSTAP